MATPIATARAASRAAAQLLPSKPATAQKARASLILEMHSKLYPHLYQGSKAKETSSEATRLLGDLEVSKRVWERKKRWMGRYKDSKMEEKRRHIDKLQVYAPKPAVQNICSDPVSHVKTSQIALLDPTGARTRLFSKTNPECARVGDILLVRQRTGDPFAGVCINIRRRGVDTAILLRGQLTRVGVEMWYKIYSPLVEGIEVVQRAAKRARRARLTYMRKEKHDRGSVENVVRMYLRQKAALGMGQGKKKGLGGGAAMGGKKGKKGKKR